MKRIVFLAYGLFCYLVMLGAIFCAICFVGNFGVAGTLDQSPTTGFPAALFINCSLCATIALLFIAIRSGNFYHRVLFNIPGPVQQSTRVLIASLLCLLFVWRWLPVGVPVWIIDDSVIQAFLRISYLSGWSIIFVSTFLIHHFDLVGLRQVWYYYRQRNYAPKASPAPGHYQLIRHPFYMGFLLVSWSAPSMTIAHLLLAISVTAYVVMSIHQGRKAPVYKHGHTY